MTGERNSVEADSARLGVLFHCAPAAASPDLERLILLTTHAAAGNPRLYALAITWLVLYGGFVAKHRLKRLAATELDARGRAVLGLILEAAVMYGAARDLRVAVEACEPAAEAGPLFDIQRGDAGLWAVAERRASALSRKWRVWAPEAKLKLDAIRPVEWLLAQNPAYRERIVRKGDLRCSILEVLKRDAPAGGRVRSESELARLSGATRTAVRKALAALVQEGEVRVAKEAGNVRDRVVVLRHAA